MNILNIATLRHTMMFGCLSSSLAIPALAQSIIPIPSTWSYTTGDEDNTAPGFSGAIHQARQNAGLSATIARGNAQLRDELLDPNTLSPFLNLAVNTDNPAVGDTWPGTMAINPDGAFIQEGMINYSADDLGLAFDEGNFTSITGAAYQDENFPGLPGDTADGAMNFQNGTNLGIEFVAWLSLPAGQTLFGVHHDDAMEVSLHPNDARDIFRMQVVGFDSNSIIADREVILDVETAGLYSVRILLAQWTGQAMLEFYTAPVDQPENLTLVNDSMVAESIKAWRSLTVPTRPYVTATTPKASATGVAPATNITVTLENLGEEMPTMEVNDTEVTYTKDVNGATTVLTYTPDSPFESGESVTVKLTYGNATSEWSFVTQTGRKAILITGGGQLNAADGWIATRLANQFGFDVTVVSDDLVNIDDATGADLIFNSSTVNSGKVAPVDFETLEIPLINVESFNCDDFRLVDVGTEFSNNPVSDTIEIIDATHPMAGGLGLGNHAFTTGGQTVQFHKAVAPAEGIPIAVPANGTGNGAHVIFGIEAGSAVEDPGGGQFIHPARRVFFGHTGNDGASNNNDVGTALFDAAVTWILAPPVSRVPVIMNAEFDGESFRIDWNSEIDRTYQVQVTDSLEEADWLPAGPNITALDEQSSFIDGEANEFPKRLYRVVLLPPGN